MAKSNEPIWWSLFFAGAGIAAMFVPALIVITGIMLPFANIGYFLPAIKMVSPGRLNELVTNPLVQVFLFLVISLSFFHWAHRFRYTVIDLGLHGARGLIAVLCYTSAFVGTGVAAWVIFWD